MKDCSNCGHSPAWATLETNEGDVFHFCDSDCLALWSQKNSAPHNAKWVKTDDFGGVEFYAGEEPDGLANENLLPVNQ